MKYLKRVAWLLPLIGLVYMYANQGIGVLIGSPEHYNIIAALGWSPETTTLLVWASVVVDLGVAILLLAFPATPLFIFAGLWTWVPRIITLIAPGPNNEFFESLAVSVLATLAYLAFKQGHTIPIRKLFFRNDSNELV